MYNETRNLVYSTVMASMTKKRKLLLWIYLLISIPGIFYSGTAVVYYSWLNAAVPNRWPTDKAAIWVGGSLILTFIFTIVFVYCVRALYKEANRIAALKIAQHNKSHDSD